MKSILFILLSIISLVYLQYSEEKNTSNPNRLSEINLEDSLTNELCQIYDEGHICGFAVAIVTQETTVYKNGFGFADKNLNIKYTTSTIQNVASISKTLIGIALLRAQEMGKLKLDDPINKYLPYEVVNPNFPNQKITIRQLATHTSSIKDTETYGGKAYVLKDDINTIPDLYVKLNHPGMYLPMFDFLKKTLPKSGEWYKNEGYASYKPGSVFEYSNIGATLAAIILERATGKSYDNFTSRYILQPLRMFSSGWSFEKIDLSKFSRLYLNQDKEIPLYKLITYPDGGLLTSVDDLSKYLSELIKGYMGAGQLLTRDSYNTLFTAQLKPDNFLSFDGENEGIFIKFLPSGLIGHTGSDPGVSTYMFFNPETKTGKILLVNTELDSAGRSEYDAILAKLDKYVNKFK